MKRNEGFTLIELIVTILVATIVAASASAVLLMGMRMHKASTEQASQQVNASFVMTALEDIAAEKQVTILPENPAETENWTVYANNNEGVLSPLFSYMVTDRAIYIGSATVSPIISDVTASVRLDGNLLTLSMTTYKDGQPDKTYTSSVYCRLVPEPAEVDPDSEPSEKSGLAPDAASSISVFSIRSVPNDYLSTNWLAVSFAQQRQNFLDVLEGELGSTGAASTGEYFSEWYIGSYADNPGWDENTPWCACFVSWALEQCAEDLMGMPPRFAHVDAFMADFSLGFWRTKDPSPGDVIFFDWTPDAVQTPEHVGVVTAVENGAVHTIEGNADGQVAKRSYAADDPCILGYGVLKWK